MAYILRSIMIVGVIALNSPIHGEKPTEGGAFKAAQDIARSAAKIDAQGAMQGLSAAREAAQIMAGLDPDTRRRLIALALPARAESAAAEKTR